MIVSSHLSKRFWLSARSANNKSFSAEGVRVPFLPEVAVVIIQRRDFMDLREWPSPQFLESHACVAIPLNQGVASVHAALPQRNRYF
jgi:hypothetical protein